MKLEVITNGTNKPQLILDGCGLNYQTLSIAYLPECEAQSTKGAIKLNNYSVIMFTLAEDVENLKKGISYQLMNDGTLSEMQYVKGESILPILPEKEDDECGCDSESCDSCGNCHSCVAKCKENQGTAAYFPNTRKYKEAQQLEIVAAIKGRN